MKNPGIPAAEALQEDLPFESALSHARFPNRSMLRVAEVAAALECSQDHVIDLITEGKLHALDISGAGNKTERKHLRIPVTAYDLYIRENRVAS